MDNTQVRTALTLYQSDRNECERKYGDISAWDTSNVTNMSRMFYRAPSFNGDISAWNTSKVTDMSGMFYRATSFNGNISAWNTSKVTNMWGMFAYASSFNSDLSAWDTSKVTNMERMFNNASSFNGDISAWDTSKVTNMSALLMNARSFNGDVSAWNTSKVTDMRGIFNGAFSFNGDVSAWDTSKVTKMRSMFAFASYFNCDLSAWDTSKVRYMRGMFYGASSFNGDVSAWDTSKVTEMSFMFNRARSFNGDISGWDTSKVTDMENMLCDCAITRVDYNWTFAQKFHLQYPPKTATRDWSAAKDVFLLSGLQRQKIIDNAVLANQNMGEDVHMDAHVHVDVEKSKRLLLLQSSCRTQRNVMLILKAYLLGYVDVDTFVVGTQVLIRPEDGSNNWEQGTITEVHEDGTYRIDLTTGNNAWDGVPPEDMKLYQSFVSTKGKVKRKAVSVSSTDDGNETKKRRRVLVTCDLDW